MLNSWFDRGNDRTVRRLSENTRKPSGKNKRNATLHGETSERGRARPWCSCTARTRGRAVTGVLWAVGPGQRTNENSSWYTGVARPPRKCVLRKWSRVIIVAYTRITRARSTRRIPVVLFTANRRPSATSEDRSAALSETYSDVITSRHDIAFSATRAPRTHTRDAGENQSNDLLILRVLEARGTCDMRTGACYA